MAVKRGNKSLETEPRKAVADLLKQQGMESQAAHEAQICLRKATTADPDFVPPHEQLAGLAVQQEDWPSALASVGHYLQLDRPDEVNAGLANFLARYG